MTENDDQESEHTDADSEDTRGDRVIDRALADVLIPPLQVGGYRWSHSSTPKLDAALAAAQGEMRNAEQNRENTHLRSRYADLAAVIVAVRDAMSKHGIARYQIPWSGADRKLYITTRIACGGEWVEADFQVPFEQLKGLRQIQSVGNAITYVKRYALTSMAGIASGEDDDGNSATDPEPQRELQREPTRAERWQTAVKAFAPHNVKPATLLAHCHKSSPADLDTDDLDELGHLCRALRRGDPQAHAAIEKARAAEST